MVLWSGIVGPTAELAWARISACMGKSGRWCQRNTAPMLFDAFDLVFEVLPPRTILGMLVIVVWTCIAKETSLISDSGIVKTDVSHIIDQTLKTLVFCLALCLNSAIAAGRAGFDQYVDACNKLETFVNAYARSAKNKTKSLGNLFVANIAAFLPLLLKHKLRGRYNFNADLLGLHDIVDYYRPRDQDVSVNSVETDVTDIVDFKYEFTRLMEHNTEPEFLSDPDGGLVSRPKTLGSETASYYQRLMEGKITQTMLDAKAGGLADETIAELWTDYLAASAKLGGWQQHTTPRPFATFIEIGMMIVIALDPFKYQTTHSTLSSIATSLLTFYFTFGIYVIGDILRNPFTSSAAFQTVKWESYDATYRIIQSAEWHFDPACSSNPGPKKFGCKI